MLSLPWAFSPTVGFRGVLAAPQLREESAESPHLFYLVRGKRVTPLFAGFEAGDSRYVHRSGKALVHARCVGRPTISPDFTASEAAVTTR